MIAALSHFWDWPRAAKAAERTAPEPPTPYRAPIFIGDVALPRGGSTEFHRQWKAAEAAKADDQP